jgi:hypothetical protein
MAQRGGARENAGRKPGEASIIRERTSLKIAQLLEKEIPPLVKALVGKAKGEEAYRFVDVPACKEIFERVSGKVAQVIAGDKENPLTLEVSLFKDLSNAELAKIVAEE